MQRLELCVGVGEERGALPAEPELQHVGRPAQRVGVRAELAVDVALHVEVAVGVRAQSKAREPAEAAGVLRAARRFQPGEEEMVRGGGVVGGEAIAEVELDAAGHDVAAGAEVVEDQRLRAELEVVDHLGGAGPARLLVARHGDDGGGDGRRSGEACHLDGGFSFSL